MPTLSRALHLPAQYEPAKISRCKPSIHMCCILCPLNCYKSTVKGGAVHTRITPCGPCKCQSRASCLRDIIKEADTIPKASCHGASTVCTGGAC